MPTKVEPDYEFQSAKWELDDGRCLIIERAAGPRSDGYNVVVTEPSTEAGDAPTERVAKGVDERAADKAARDWLTAT